MAAGSSVKVAVITAPLDLAFNGSKPLILKPMPLYSWPSSMVVLASSTSLKPAPQNSAQV